MRALRFLWVAGWQTLRCGTRAIVASWRRLPDRPGGVYDEAIRSWSQALLDAGGVEVRRVGAERLSSEPAVYVANHVSMIDIWALVTALPRAPKFIFKKELLRIPVLGAAARAAGHIRIDRRNRAAAFTAYQEAAGVIRAGAPAVVFAEGTRSRDGRLLPFKKGPFVLAIAAQVPVVPVLVSGSFELMPRKALVPRPGTVTLRFGDPIPTEGLGYDDRDPVCAAARRALLALGARE